MPHVRIEPSGLSADLAPGEAILPGLNRCGITVRTVGCRRGGCGICKITLVSGRVTYDKVVADTVLSADERASGTCLTCRAVPEGDVVLHIDQSDFTAAPPGLLRYLNPPPPPPPLSPPPPPPSAQSSGTTPRASGSPTHHQPVTAQRER